MGKKKRFCFYMGKEGKTPSSSLDERISPSFLLVHSLDPSSFSYFCSHLTSINNIYQYPNLKSTTLHHSAQKSKLSLIHLSTPLQFHSPFLFPTSQFKIVPIHPQSLLYAPIHLHYLRKIFSWRSISFPQDHPNSQNYRVSHTVRFPLDSYSPHPSSDLVQKIDVAYPPIRSPNPGLFLLEPTQSGFFVRKVRSMQFLFI